MLKHLFLSFVFFFFQLSFRFAIFCFLLPETCSRQRFVLSLTSGTRLRRRKPEHPTEGWHAINRHKVTEINRMVLGAFGGVLLVKDMSAEGLCFRALVFLVFSLPVGGNGDRW